MCIIVAKEKGNNMPTKSTLKECFLRNSDGAGLMYTKNNNVVIEKGFMDFGSFYKRIKELKKEFNSDLKDVPMVFHFRIGTQGKNDKFTCHPFMISNKSEDLKRTRVKTNIGMVHNGIISTYSRVREDNLSDTQLFIKYCVSIFNKMNRNFYKDDEVLDYLYSVAQSKLCFLDKEGNIYYRGDFIEDNGIKYSNSTYKPYKVSTTYYDYRKWYEDDDYYYSNSYNYYNNYKTNYAVFGYLPKDYLVLNKKTGSVLDSNGTNVKVYKYFKDGLTHFNNGRLYMTYGEDIIIYNDNDIAEDLEDVLKKLVKVD